MDLSRVSPAVQADYEARKQELLQDNRRTADIDSLKMLKNLRRELIRDAQLNDRSVDTTELDEMIERLVERLT